MASTVVTVSFPRAFSPIGYRTHTGRPSQLPAARAPRRSTGYREAQARTCSRHARAPDGLAPWELMPANITSDRALKDRTCADGVVQQECGGQRGVWMGAAKAVEARRRVRTSAFATTRLFTCQGSAGICAHLPLVFARVA